MFGLNVPGTSRAEYIQYSFDAKLGIEGKDVTIESQPDNTFVITIPQYIFIGFDNSKYEVAAESNGLLSWTTPEIESTEMITNIINDTAKEKYIKENTELLKNQTTSFYTDIIRSIDSEVKLRFVFL